MVAAFTRVQVLIPLRVALALYGLTGAAALAQARPDTARGTPPGRDTTQRRDTSRVRDTTATRDRIGDLNAGAVAGGAFPGSFVLPGTNVSLGIGGFVKVLAYHDSDADERAPEFAPADLAPNVNGGGTYSMTANVSRVFLDVRTTTERQTDVRAYTEIDFNGPSVVKLRHAYLRLRTPDVEVRAGQTWSTFMNAAAKPDLLGEAATSGLAELRQTQIRFTNHVSRELHPSVSIENPSSSDVGGEVEATRTPAPDVVLSVAYEGANASRVQLAGVGRRLQVVLADGSTPSTNAWGAQLSFSVEPAPRHVVRAEGLVGDGIGRYLQGLDAAGAGFVSPDGDIDTRHAWGASASYEQPWSATLRSVLVAGTASATTPAYVGAGAFDRSDLLAVNLLWRASRYTTIGIEYAYGQRRNVDAPSRHNHQVVLGLQLF